MKKMKNNIAKSNYSNSYADLRQLSPQASETLIAILSTSTYEEAAESLGISDVALWARRKKYNLDKIVDRFPQEALQRLKMYSIRAADTLGRVLKHSNPAYSMNAASEILDRVGVSKGPQIVIDNRQVINEVEFILDETST